MLNHYAQTINNLLNPIMVKELRQSVRSQFVVILLNLFLGAQFLIVLIYFLGYNANSISDGQGLFVSLAALLIGVSVACVPGYTAHRLSNQLRSGDMIFSTSMRPFQVIWGYFLSGVVMSALFFSASAPFLTLTYMMRGLDLQTILWTLYFGFIAVEVLNCLAILVGTLKISAILQVIFAFIFVYWATFINDIFGFLPFFSFSGSGLSVDTWSEALSLVAATFGLAVLIGGTVLFWAAVRIAPESSSRMTGVRIFQAVCILAILAIFWSVCLFKMWREGSFDFDLLRYGEVLAMVLIAIHAQIGICERTVYSHRMIRAIPQNRRRQIAAYPFFTSAYSAIAWSFLMFGVIVVSDHLIFVLNSNVPPLFCTETVQFWGIILFFVAYGTGAFVFKEILNWIRGRQTRLQVNSRQTPGKTAETIEIPPKMISGGLVWGIEANLVFLAIAAPTVFCYFLFGLTPDDLHRDSGAYALNVFVYMDHYDNDNIVPFFLGFLSLGYWVFAICRDFVGYMRRYVKNTRRST